MCKHLCASAPLLLCALASLSPAGAVELFRDDFESGTLDPTRWEGLVDARGQAVPYRDWPEASCDGLPPPTGSLSCNQLRELYNPALEQDVDTVPYVRALQQELSGAWPAWETNEHARDFCMHYGAYHQDAAQVWDGCYGFCAEHCNWAENYTQTVDSFSRGADGRLLLQFDVEPVYWAAAMVGLFPADLTMTAEPHLDDGECPGGPDPGQVHTTLSQELRSYSLHFQHAGAADIGPVHDFSNARWPDGGFVTWDFRPTVRQGDPLCCPPPMTAGRFRLTLEQNGDWKWEWYQLEWDEVAEDFLPLVGNEDPGQWVEGSTGSGGGTDTSYRFAVDYKIVNQNPSQFNVDNVIITDGSLPEPPTPTGACNLPGGAGGGTCVILTQEECTSQDGTYDGDGTICPLVGSPNIPGDCNQDGEFDLSDVICVLGHLFQGNPATLPCSTTAANLNLMDCNNDGSIDLSDAIWKLAFLFQGGPPPVAGTGCMQIVDCPANQGCP